MRNAYAQTGIPPYSVRPKAGAPVATPLDWSELGDRKLHAGRYTLRNVLKRLSRIGDPWQDIARQARSLQRPRRLLQELQDTE
jgi:bifunctional non-homologous end joining protein LigD